MKESIDTAGAAIAAVPRRTPPLFVIAADSQPVVAEIRALLTDLLGHFDLDVLPQEGPVVLDRLRAQRPRLAFVSMDLRLMEGLTLLRALPHGRARQTVLLVPDTLEGYRLAWDGLYFGARDFVVTRGAPPQRLKGGTLARRRQMAHLLATEWTSAHGDGAGFEGAWTAVPASGPVEAGADPAAPWVALPETRQLAAVAGWLRRLSPEAPALLRLPEGPRFLRVAREGLERLLCRPVRIASNGDRLVPGHLLLVSDADLVSIEDRIGYPHLRLDPVTDPPGGRSAERAAFHRLASSPCRLRVVLPESSAEDLEELPRELHVTHGVYRLRPATPDEIALDFSLEPGATRRAA